jgi:diguanylate cyclase (GGDEF)-like protein/PAS domain S-box-containing protein
MFRVGTFMDKERSRLLHWSDWPLLAKGMVVVVLPLVVLALSRIPLYRVLVSTEAADKVVTRTSLAQLQLAAIQGSLLDAETGVRGYVATGEHLFLQPYDAARVRLPRQLDALRQTISQGGDAGEVANTIRLRELTSQELTLLDQLEIAGATLRPTERATLLTAAKTTMDETRRVLNGMNAHERRDLATETAVVTHAARWTRLMLAAGFPIGLAGGILAILLFARGIRKRILVLGNNARSLAAGDPLPPTSPPRDEIGQLDIAMRTAGALLVDREARLSLAMEAGRFVPYESDPQTGSFTFLYPEQVRKFGFSSRDLPTTTDEWQARIHPEDRERVAGARSSFIESGTDYEEEYRIVSPDGTVRQLASRARLHGDPHHPTVVGVMVDVTLENLAERDRVQSHEQLTKVFYASPVPIAITSAVDGTHLQVNDAWCRLTGFTKEEALGRTALEMGIWEDPDARQDVVDRLRESGGSLRDVEMRHRRKSGEILDTLISLESIEFGDVPATILMIHDMTERKQAEEALRHSLDARSAEDERHRAELAKLSITDDLTNLLNPRGFRLLAEHEFAQADRTRSGLVLLFADLDGLKHINDTLGHAMGSRALADAADLLRATFRDSDVLARVGGDEFCVLLSSAPSERAARMAVVRLRRALVAHNAQNVRLYKLSLSIGAARRDPGSGVTIEQMTEIADAQMYREKLLKREERVAFLTQKKTG